jgi:hypothetical protein
VGEEALVAAVVCSSPAIEQPGSGCWLETCHEGENSLLGSRARASRARLTTTTMRWSLLGVLLVARAFQMTRSVAEVANLGR